MAELIPKVVTSLQDEEVTAVACGSAHTAVIGGNHFRLSLVDSSFSADQHLMHVRVAHHESWHLQLRHNATDLFCATYDTNCATYDTKEAA